MSTDSSKPAGLSSAEQSAMGIVFLLSLFFTVFGGYSIFYVYPNSIKPEYWVVFVSSLLALLSLVHVASRMVASGLGWIELLFGIVMGVGNGITITAFALIFFGLLYGILLRLADKRVWESKST